MDKRNRKDIKKHWLRYISLITVVCLAFPLISCDETNQREDDQVKSYYDISGFIEGQIVRMNNEQPKVSKTVSMGSETNQISGNKIDWKKELELFMQADINKPAYRLSYITQRPDSLTTIYIVKQGEKQLSVHYLKIVLDRVYKVPLHVSAVLKSENKLYKSEKNIELNCAVNNTGSRIISYSITGYQKLVTMDKKPFDVKAKVLY